MSETMGHHGLANDRRSTTSGLSASFSKVPVTVQVMLGSAILPLPEMLALSAGSTFLLDQKLGAAVTVIVNGCRIAMGELYVIEGDGDRLGVKITDIVKDNGNAQPVAAARSNP
jgi:flagellar motor switch protein FliN